MTLKQFNLVLIYFFLTTNYPLNKRNTTKVLTNNFVKRISISFSGLIMFVLLSFLCSCLKWSMFWILSAKSLCLRICGDEDDGCDHWICGVILIISSVFFLIIALCTNILKLFYIIFVGTILFLSEKIVSFYIWTKKIQFDVQEMLAYGYLSDEELQ